MDNKQNTAELKTGGILVSSWGYDQTNIDFFQIIKCTDKTVTVCKVENRIVENGSSGFNGKVEPIKNMFTGTPLRRKIKRCSGIPTISITSFSSARPWGGKPEDFTSYA